VNDILDWGIKVILWVQQARPVLDLPARAITFCGEELFFLLFLPLIYWCLDRRNGAWLTVTFLVSAYINALAKTLAGQPRPADYSDSVWAFSDVGGSGGFPSGHTQHSVVVWGFLAARWRKAWVWGVAIAAMLLIPLSRIYLGVHFPHDLAGGYLIGGLLLLASLYVGPYLIRWIAARDLIVQLCIIAAGALALALVFPTEDGITGGASLLGAGLGLVLERRWVRFEVSGVLWKRVLRFVLGAVGLFAAWAGLRILFAGLEPAGVYRFVRYTALTGWAALGAPWAFVRLGLATARSVEPQP